MDNVKPAALNANNAQALALIVLLVYQDLHLIVLLEHALLQQLTIVLMVKHLTMEYVRTFVLLSSTSTKEFATSAAVYQDLFQITLEDVFNRPTPHPPTVPLVSSYPKLAALSTARLVLILTQSLVDALLAVLTVSTASVAVFVLLVNQVIKVLTVHVFK